MPDAAEKSILKELNQLLDKQVFQPADPSTKDFIPSSTFLKEKFTPDGIFDVLKSRIVAHGNRQNRSTYSDAEISSMTARTESIFITAHQEAKEKRYVCTTDVPGAYLNSNLGRIVHMLLPPQIASRLIKIRPEWSHFLRFDGSLIVKLTKSLYGLIEAGKLWFDNIAGFLTSIDFKQNAADPCVFQLNKNGTICDITLVVDDIKASSSNRDILLDLHSKLESKYGPMKLNWGTLNGSIISIPYIGMMFNYNKTNGTVTITAPDYLTKLLEEYKITGTCSTPATSSLFQTTTGESIDTHDYKSLLMKIMYYAKRIRPEILLAVSHLATKTEPNTSDWSQLFRILRYLNGSKNIGLTLGGKNNGNLTLRASVDASFGVHCDLKSHSAIIFTLDDSGTFLYKSQKQKITSRSSTEAELIALYESTSHIFWLRKFLSELGFPQTTTVIEQDNLSTMHLANYGPKTTGRSRYIDLRYFYIKEKIEDKEIKLEHIASQDLVADILTKPLSGALFIKLRQRLLNIPQ
jgi:hypothetical protein